MNHEQKVFVDAVISLTANKEWDVLTEELKKEIYQHQANLLDNAKSWDDVVFTKGWCGTLAYIITLRQQAKTILEQEAASASV